MALLSPHGHAVALLCAASRLLVACPRVATILESDEGFGRAAPAAHAHEDPDAPHALQSTAWHLALLEKHHHPLVAEVAHKLAAQEPLPPHLLRATPLYIMSAYSDAEGAFKPAPNPPKPRPAATDEPRKAPKAGAGVSKLEDVRAAAAAAADRAGKCQADFRALL